MNPPADCPPETRRYPFSIRRATLADLDTLVRLRLALIAETDPAEAEPDGAVAQANRSFMEKKLPGGDFVAWLAEMDGQVVGTIGLVFFDRPPHSANLTGIEAYVMNMYTLPDRRGMGVASALMEEVVAFVKQGQARRIWLHATEAGRKVYARLGFIPNHTEMEINL